MRTDSHRFAGTLVALGFVAGWLSASWLSPPTAVTQTGPPRTATAAPEVPMPRVALDVVTAPETTLATARNPFVFAARRAVPSADPMAADGGPASPSASSADSPALPETAPAAPAWRVFGIAADADGRITAVVSGGGEVFLLGLEDRLPDGSVVAAIDAGGLVLTRAGGERLVLRLP